MSNGLSQKIFHLIWTPSDILSSSKSLHLNLPDTVLFDKGQPLFWFYSKNEGLRKKKRENVTLNNILERMEVNVGGSGVCAYFISLTNEGIGGRQEIQYFKTDELKEFFHENINRFPRGFLQKFVEPYGSKNTLFKVNWSKNFVVLTKGINSKNITNRKIDTFERCCTFDGPEMFSEKKSVSGKISFSLTELSNSVTNHISSLTYGSMEIKTANFFFKQAEDATLFFLWASEVEFQTKSRASFVKGNETPILIPKNIEKRMTINLQKPLTLNKNVLCLMCGRENFNDQFTEVTYKEIISNQEKILLASPRLPLSRTSSSFQKSSLLETMALFKLPPLFQKLYPRLTPQNYHILRETKSFLSQTIRICFSCFYLLTGDKQGGEGGGGKRQEEERRRREEGGGYWEQERNRMKEEGRRRKEKKGLRREEEGRMREGENIWEEEGGWKEEGRRREEGTNPENEYFLYKGYDDYFTINDGLINEMGGWGGGKKSTGEKGGRMREGFSLEEGGGKKEEGGGSRRESCMRQMMEEVGRRRKEEIEGRREEEENRRIEKKSGRRRTEESEKEEGIRKMIFGKREEEGGSTRSTEEGEEFWEVYQDAQRLEKHLKRKNEKCADLLKEVRR